MDKKSNTTKWIIAGAAGAFALGALYLVLKKKGPAVPEEQAPTGKDGQIKLEPYEKILNKKEFQAVLKNSVAKHVKVQNGLYSKEVVFDILKAFYHTKFDDFKTLFYRYRKERRRISNDEDKYFEAGFTYFQEMNALFMEGFDKLFIFGIVDQQKWGKSMEIHQIPDQEITALMFETVSEWESKLPSTKKLTKPQLLEVLTFEDELLKKEMDELDDKKEMVLKTGDLFEYLIIINSKVSDKVYDRYQVENEEILGFVKSHQEDEEVKYKEDSIVEVTQGLAIKITNILSEDPNNESE